MVDRLTERQEGESGHRARAKHAGNGDLTVQPAKQRRRLLGMRAILAIALLAALSSCGVSGISPSTPQLASGADTQDGITLSAMADPATLSTGDVIDVSATLSHDAGDDLALSGSGSGVVFFTVTRIEDGLTSGPPMMTGDCAGHVLPAGEPTVIPFEKSGGYSPGDPNAAFMDAYYSDPLLTLPSGTWRIDVATYANIGPGCTGVQLDLAVELIVTVTD